MKHDIENILIGRAAIAERVSELADEICRDFGLGDGEQASEITLVPILTGSFIFVADLVRHLPFYMQISLMSVSSYRGQTTHSDVAHLREDLTNLPETFEGSHVLIIDDILDSGQTLKLVYDLLKARNPASIKSCVLLRKDRPEAMDTKVDYVAFDIPDEFVVGYGLDYNDYYRNLPDIVTLKQHVIESDR